jgi:hypothetical protein
MPSARTYPTKRTGQTPASNSEVRANVQGLGARDNHSETGACNDRMHVGRSYGPAGVARRSMVLASRREVLLGASGLVLLAMCSPPVSLDPSGQEPWGDGTLWSDGLGWVA